MCSIVTFLGKIFPQSLPKRYETGLRETMKYEISQEKKRNRPQKTNEIAMKYRQRRNEIDPQETNEMSPRKK